MTTQRFISIRSAGLATVLLVAVSAVAAAQRPTTPPTPPPHPAPAPQAAPQATQQPTKPPNPNRPPSPNFTGVAKQLGTTPQALDDAYKAALATNPKLTRGQFIAANILAKNLGTKYPSVTTQAVLDGLAGGKSIGQTLEGLGLSAGEAKSAEAQANREARGGRRGGR